VNGKHELLAQLTVSGLAALCQEAADDNPADEVTIDKALRLKRRWIELVSRETPPEPNLVTHIATRVELTFGGLFANTGNERRNFVQEHQRKL
jgi:hypothetical protein